MLVRKVRRCGRPWADTCPTPGAGCVAASHAHPKPAGPTSPLAEPVTPWTQVFGASVVALIPCDDASPPQALKENAAWRIAVRAGAFVGSYVFRGAFLSPDKRLRVLICFEGFVAQAVESECRLAGAPLAPDAVVVTQHRQPLRPLARALAVCRRDRVLCEM
jgi:hypothetical protein